MGRRGETNKQKPVAGVLFHHRDSQNDSCETRVSQSSERVETDPDKKQTNTTWSTRLQKQRGVKEQTSLCLVVEIRELTPADWKIWTSVSQPRQSRLLRHRSAAAELCLWVQRAHYSHVSGCCFNLFCHFYNKTLGEGVFTSLQSSSVEERRPHNEAFVWQIASLVLLNVAAVSR